MRYKVQPEDFAVEEQIQLSLAPKGRFAIYRVRKRGVTTLSVRAQMARALGLPLMTASHVRRNSWARRSTPPSGWRTITG